jgi:hypothetical protein
VQQTNALRSQTGELEQFGDGRRHLAMQPIEKAAGAGGANFADLAFKVGADPRQFRQGIAPVEQRIQFPSVVPHRARGVVVGADAKRVIAADLEQVGDLLENNGDVGVVDGHRSPLAAEQVVPAAAGIE